MIKSYNPAFSIDIRNLTRVTRIIGRKGNVNAWTFEHEWHTHWTIVPDNWRTHEQ